MGLLSTSHCRATVWSSTRSLTKEHTVFFHGQSADFLDTKVLFVPTIFLVHGDRSLGAVEFGLCVFSLYLLTFTTFLVLWCKTSDMGCNINNPACCTISLEAFVLQVELLSEVMNDCTTISMDYISSVRIITSNDWKILHILQWIAENFISYFWPCIHLGGVYFIIESSNASSLLFDLHFTYLSSLRWLSVLSTTVQKGGDCWCNDRPLMFWSLLT